MSPDELEIVLFADRGELEAWLEDNAAESDGLWLKIAKKGAPVPSVTYDEAVELALCFGWIDSQKRGLDETHFLQRFTPRRPRGRWSKINREKAEALEADGRPASVRRRRGRGRQGRRPLGGRLRGRPHRQGPRRPPAALDASPKAAASFADLDGANRYAIIWRLGDAKKPETRTRRLAKFIAMLERGEKLHGQPRRGASLAGWKRRAAGIARRRQALERQRGISAATTARRRPSRSLAENFAEGLGAERVPVHLHRRRPAEGRREGLARTCPQRCSQSVAGEAMVPSGITVSQRVAPAGEAWGRLRRRRGRHR